MNDELKLVIKDFKMPERDLPMVGLTATIKADRNALCTAGECFVEYPKDPIHTIVATIPRVATGSLKIMLGLNTVSTEQNEYLFEFEQVNLFPLSTRFTFFFGGKRPKIYSSNVDPSQTLQKLTLPVDGGSNFKSSDIVFENDRTSTGVKANNLIGYSELEFDFPADKFGVQKTKALRVDKPYDAI